MCGICGIIGGCDRNQIDAMVKAMHHRGPDDAGVFINERVALGMSRLAVIDLTPKAHQPMQNDDASLWIVYNGETYNFKDERDILIEKGYVFRSTSDTEVVLKMYKAYGDDFLIRMRGIFSLAIYDKRKGKDRLLLARDPLGVKPLIYANVGSKFVFSSEMKSILASGLVERKFDPESLRLLLSYGSITQPRTAVSGVNMLLPGHRMIVKSGSTRIERFWQIRKNTVRDLRDMPYDKQVDYMRTSLNEAIRLQMVSDVPIGAFLSGGVDSTLLVALMSRMSGAKVKTFSVGFEQEGRDIDETDDAERVAKYLGTEHFNVMVTGEEVRDRINHIARALDQPSVDGVNSYFVSMAARQEVTVAISGTGGDELFAGYPWFINMLKAYGNKENDYLTIKKIIASILQHHLFNSLALGRFEKYLDRARASSGFVSRYARQYKIFGTKRSNDILHPKLRHQAQVGREPSYDIVFTDEFSSGLPVERVSALCLRGYTQNQLLRDIDAVSMAHSLEVRVPYLDPVIVDTAFSLPENTKIGDVNNITNAINATYKESGAKKILIDVGRGLLPDGIALQKKRGFGMPFETWLKGPMQEILEDTLSEKTVINRGLFDAPMAKHLKKRFLTGKSSWAFPWLLMMIELWCREVLDNTSHMN